MRIRGKYVMLLSRIHLQRKENCAINKNHRIPNLIDIPLNIGLIIKKGQIVINIPLRFFRARSPSLRLMNATKPQFLCLAFSSSLRGHMIFILANGPNFPNISINCCSVIYWKEKKTQFQCSLEFQKRTGIHQPTR